MKHTIAVYYNARRERIKINSGELSNSKTFDFAERQFLLDISEQFVLRPRHGVEDSNDVTIRKPHFYSPSKERVRKFYDTEDDPTHKQRIVDLTGDLAKCEKWSIFPKHPPRGQVPSGHIFSLDDYDWGLEIHRIVGEDAIVRHDLFGQSRQMKMSITRPWIAIEVINTHYPEEPAFKALIELSRMMPLLVIFDITAKKNFFFKVDHTSGNMVAQLYIYDGCVWYRGEKTDIATSGSLKQHVTDTINTL